MAEGRPALHVGEMSLRAATRAGGASESMTAIDCSAEWGLVGDIGATNARFALVRPDGGIALTRAILCNDFPTLADAICDRLIHSAHKLVLKGPSRRDPREESEK